ncbi:hypothetical protein ABZ916_22620 [Streptomyces sp. NPDC046853]|uniref:hypothetical protein n=1 Tax=Streptomyces sp. NPDC046853 TaxID=3154920 RepID=UPI0033E0B4B8
MNVQDHGEQEPTAAALKVRHAARAESAAARAAALSHYVEQSASGSHADAVWKAAHAARVAAQALAVLSESEPDPAADSRCARNAAASAAQASQMGQLVDGTDVEASAHACRAALLASQAAGAAAGAKSLGVDEGLNAEADAAEKAAVTAAEAAGWIRPGEDVPSVATGVRSPEVMTMMHL